MKIKPRVLTLFLALIMVLSLVGCGGQKVYWAESSELYCYGERLDGPSVDPDECYLIVNGSNVEYHDYSHIFKGTISSSFVLWDNDPDMLADGTHAYTKIFKRSKGGYSLTITYKYPLDDGMIAYVDNQIDFAK